jgi:uncharacterized NAD(P)/FAD-binding protein YdhS
MKRGENEEAMSRIAIIGAGLSGRLLALNLFGSHPMPPSAFDARSRRRTRHGTGYSYQVTTAVERPG